MTAEVPPAARRARLACHLELDRNPLRRRTDWPESAIMAGPIAVFLAGAPLAAIGVGGRAHSIGEREQCAEQSWHQVSVVLLQAVPRHAAFRHWFQLARVWAQWMPPAESMRAAEVWLAACETAWKSAGPHWTTSSLAGADSCPFADADPGNHPIAALGEAPWVGCGAVPPLRSRLAAVPPGRRRCPVPFLRACSMKGASLGIQTRVHGHARDRLCAQRGCHGRLLTRTGDHRSPFTMTRSSTMKR